MSKSLGQRLILIISLLLLTTSVVPSPPVAAADQLQIAVPAALNDVEFTWNQSEGVPLVLRGQMPLASDMRSAQVDAPNRALAFLEHYRSLFGIQDAQQELSVLKNEVDELGLTHVVMQQKHQGWEVHNAQVKVHINSAKDIVYAVDNGFLPGLQVAETQPQLSLNDLRVVVKRMAPTGLVHGQPTLQIYAPPGRGRAAENARLAWLVEVSDAANSLAAIYVVDAVNGKLLDMINQLHAAEHIATYDAHNTWVEGLDLRRVDNGPPVGDYDLDTAHDLTWEVYNYYRNAHGRNSFDDLDSVISSNVHFGVDYQNAGWNAQTKQMIYGDGFVFKDVVAHELTHGVTQHTAHLVYWWQPGALNESFSDIFAAMVDDEDWLIGEDLPAGFLNGHAALRDMEHPKNGVYPQPGHTRDWVVMCSDLEGVHTNSGIFNKAFFNIATSMGRTAAAGVFYRALASYMGPLATLESARANVLQATADLYGGDSAQYTNVLAGFDAVGLDGVWEPPASDLCGCPATASLSASQAAPAAIPAQQVLATLYQVRDQVLVTTPVGQHYRQLFYKHAIAVTTLFLAEPTLRLHSTQLLQAAAPGLQGLVNGTTDESVLTPEFVHQLRDYTKQLQQAATQYGNAALAHEIQAEVTPIDWQTLEGMTFAEAWDYLNSLQPSFKLYMPLVAHSAP